MDFNKIRVLFFSFIFITVSGCASFEKQKIPRVEILSDISQYQNKPSVFVDLTFYRGLPYKNPVEISKMKEKLISVVGSAFDTSRLFSNCTFEKSSKEEQDYTIKIDIYDYGNNELAYVSGFITGYTFGLIPGAATDNYMLNMQIIDKKGVIIKKYTNEDAVQTWFGIWFIPFMGNTQEKAMASTLKNQVMTALKELLYDGVINYSYLRNSLSNT